MANKSNWKGRERQVAEWMGSVRNPLSGRNNAGDDGTPRVGDIIIPWGVVEVKTRTRNSSILRAAKTRKDASRAGLPWVHVEFSKGVRDAVCIVGTFESAIYMLNMLRTKWKTEKPV